MADEVPNGAYEKWRTERRDALVPLVLLSLVVGGLGLVVALTAAQDGTGDSGSPGKKSAVAAAIQTPSQRLRALPAATSANTDMALHRVDPATHPVKPGPKTFDLTTSEHDVNIGGKRYRMWMFNKSVPGPVQRVVVGDRVTIRIHNAGSSTYVHSIDYHSSMVSGGGAYVQVPPGKTGSFTFVPRYPGVFMYHCGTPPVLHHIGMGMYGMMIVQPREGFGAPMREFAFVQSELYASTDDMERQQPTQTAFNGIPRQYVNDPIHLRPDEHVRVFFINAGPSNISSFHVVGSIMDRAYADGNPANLTRGRQTIVLGASGGMVAELQLAGEGKFPFVTHQFGHGEMGAVGMFMTGDGDPVGPGSATSSGGSMH